MHILSGNFAARKKTILKYDNITPAVFLNRPNRFLAEVDLGGQKETVHVKNTGRSRELIRTKQDGFLASLAFVIQMDGLSEVRPNTETHPEFGKVLKETEQEDVKVVCLKCHVDPDRLEIVCFFTEGEVHAFSNCKKGYPGNQSRCCCSAGGS